MGSRSRIAALMAFEAATLVVFVTLHLTGTIGGGSKPHDPSEAGVAEAVIAAALLSGAAALLRAHASAHGAAVAAVGSAIIGFLIGITITAQFGPAIDVAYHASLLPLLILTFALLLRARGPKRSQRMSSRAGWQSGSTI